MATLFRHRTSRSVAFWTLAASTLVLHTIVTAITIRLATNDLSATQVHVVALSAAILDVCVLAALLVRLALCFYRNAHAALTAFHALLIVLSLAAAVMTMYTLGWALTNQHRTSSLASADVALWTLAFISQTGFYVTLLWPSRHPGAVLSGEPMAEHQSPSRSGKLTPSIHLTPLTPAKPPFVRSDSASPSPKDSGFTLSPRSSIRNSVHQALRPMTSKTRLLLRNSFASADSPSVQSMRPTSFDTTHHNDGFETWDTSAVEDADASPSAQKTARSRLETIPGSRPVSPARPLDGPFLHDPPPAEETPLPDSPVRSPVTSPGSETSSILAFPLPPPRRPSTSQSHIHPLFRPESPLPPPIPSPGTVIVASPFAGQVVSQEQALSSKALSSSQGSRPGSATPMSPAENKPGSFRGFRMNSTASGEPPFASPLREG